MTRAKKISDRAGQFAIDGAWTDAEAARTIDVVNPATEAAICNISLVTGGPGRPEGLAAGYYVKPTVFSDVRPDMTVAREEIFGPVLAIIGYDDEEHAIRIANDTPFGLAGYVSSADHERARRVARRINAGMVHINMAVADPKAPFGGAKQSGNGREWGVFGIEEYLEVKSIMGWNGAA